MASIQVYYDGSVQGAVVGQLDYGTPFTDLPGHPRSFYVKVNKRKLGEGLTMNVPRNHSVLMNIKTGTLRTVSGNTPVTVLEGSVKFYRSEHPSEHFKKDQ